MRRLAVEVAAGVLSSFLGAGLAVAQTVSAGQSDQKGPWPIDVETAPRPEARATRTTAKIVVDGHIDEPAWEQAEPISDFIQLMPETGYPATERTVVRVLFDDKNLYISAICYDSDTKALFVKTLEYDLPDVSTHEIDMFSVYLDTFLDRRNGFMWLIGPQANYRDGQSFNDSRVLDFGWDGIAVIKTDIQDTFWTVEMSVPWTTLRFDPTKKEQVWGANFLRRVRRKGEESVWSPLDRRDRGHRMSKAGTLRGIEATRPGRNIGLKPYAVAKSAGGAAVLEKDQGGSFNGGLDFKFGITPRLTMDLTYRTDFSHVEVDRQQVNLTRFPLFFPEMRDFFIENSGTFQFGDVTERNYRTGTSMQDFTLFHSRQVGLKGGRPVPIFGGGRLTGHAGGFEIGLLDVQTHVYEGQPAENFAVTRVRRNVGGSDFGFMFGNRQATGGAGSQHYNRSYGADANVRLFTNMMINSYLAMTQAPDSVGNNKAARVSVGWRDAFWDTTVFAKQIGEAFNPGIGFVRRTGIRHYYGTLGVHPRVRSTRVLEVNPYVEGEYITDMKNDLETRTQTAGFGVTFVNGAEFSTTVNDRFERLDEPFTVRAGTAIPVGGYNYRDASVKYSWYTSKPTNALSGSLGASGGGYYGGTIRTVGGSVLWERDYHLSVNLSVNHNAISVVGQSFTADVYGVRMKYAPNTRLFFGAYVQYNAASDQVVTNLRMWFRHAPLSDFYIVYTDRRSVSGSGLQERLFTVKVTKWFQF